MRVITNHTAIREASLIDLVYCVLFFTVLWLYPLHLYLQHGGRDESSPYVFTSQRSPHLTEYGIHQWFRTLKQHATKDQWALIGDVTFHDLRHDFAHRARDVGWTLEEVAYYLGHMTQRGTPAIQTTMRYTQVSRAQVREKLRLLRE